MIDLHYKYLLANYQLIFNDLTLFIKKGLLFEKAVLYNHGRRAGALAFGAIVAVAQRRRRVRAAV